MRAWKTGALGEREVVGFDVSVRNIVHTFHFKTAQQVRTLR
jgi:hypothetical protein